jgi:hypothetical protein
MEFLKIPLQVIMGGLRGPFITPRGSVDTKILFKIGPLIRKVNIYYLKLMFLKKNVCTTKTVLMTRHFTF